MRAFGLVRFVVCLAVALGMPLFLPSSAPLAAASARVVLEAGRLTIDVREAPLSEVLRAIGEQAKVAVKGNPLPTARVTMTFDSTPLDDGIKRLLQGVSYVLIYSPAEDQGAGQRALVEIWLLGSYLGSETARAEARALTTPVERDQPATASAVASVTEPSTPPIAEWIWRALERPEVSARVRAIQMLGRERHPTAINALVQILREDAEPVARQHAATALATIGGQEAAAAFGSALEDLDPFVRIRAVQGLSQIEGEKAVDQLETTLESDTDFRVRREAVRALSRLSGDQALQALERAVSHRDGLIRSEAAAALARQQGQPTAGASMPLPRGNGTRR